jgi:hypothetical protein
VRPAPEQIGATGGACYIRKSGELDAFPRMCSSDAKHYTAHLQPSRLGFFEWPLPFLAMGQGFRRADSIDRSSCKLYRPSRYSRYRNTMETLSPCIDPLSQSESLLSSLLPIRYPNGKAQGCDDKDGGIVRWGPCCRARGGHLRKAPHPGNDGQSRKGKCERPNRFSRLRKRAVVTTPFF